MQLAQLKASTKSSEALTSTFPFSPVKLQSVITLTASSLPALPEKLLDIPSLYQLCAQRKTGSSLPNNDLFSTKGTVECNKLDLEEFICRYLEFCKGQPEASKVHLLKHLQLLMEHAITYCIAVLCAGDGLTPPTP